ncbi:MAG TPA: response regulator [Acidobacteriota bacterium]|nr:response regulator [Acidobacteriota bacterium]
MKKEKESTVPNGTIAVIEEFEDSIYSIKFILQSLGYRVESIAAKADLLSRLQEFAPDLIIVDMLIPNNEGLSVIRFLKEEGFREKPVLAITADAVNIEESEIKEAGADVVLTKPYAVTELQKVLEKYIGTS